MIALIFVALTLIFTVAFGFLLSMKYFKAELVITSVSSNIKIDGVSIEDMRSGKADDSKLSQIIIDEIKKYFNVEIDHDTVTQLLDDFDASEYVQKYINEFTDYIEQGGDLPLINVDDYVNALMDNDDVLEEALERPIEDTEYYKIREKLVKTVESYNRRAAKVNNSYQTLLKYSQDFSSVWALAGCGVLIFVQLGIMIFIYKKNGTGIYRAFRNFSIPIMSTGLAMIILRYAIPIFVVKKLGKDLPILLEIIYEMFSFISRSGLVILISGAVFFVAFIILDIIYTKKLDEKIKG